MKRWIRLAVLSFLCFSGMAYVSAFSETTLRAESSDMNSDLDEQSWLAGNPEDVAAVILHTNDVHVGFEDNIGYDGVALYKKELEKQYDHVLLIDAGDAIQGAPIGAISKGAEIIKMMNHDEPPRI